MKKKCSFKSFIAVLLICVLFLTGGCSAGPAASASSAVSSQGHTGNEQTAQAVPDEDGSYYSKDDVSLYLHTYHHLPDNYITKKQARALGWEGGPVEPYAPGKAIGGDVFGNYEGNLPEDHTYHECDLDTEGKSRGAKRLVWSDDWYIYYTEDHYETFELLYTEKEE